MTDDMLSVAVGSRVLVGRDVLTILEVGLSVVWVGVNGKPTRLLVDKWANVSVRARVAVRGTTGQTCRLEFATTPGVRVGLCCHRCSLPAEFASGLCQTCSLVPTPPAKPEKFGALPAAKVKPKVRAKPVVTIRGEMAVREVRERSGQRPGVGALRLVGMPSKWKR